MSNYHERSDNVEHIIFNKNEPTQNRESTEITVGERPVRVTHWNAVEGEFLCLARFMVDGCLCDAEGNIIFEKDEECNFICLCCKCPTYIIKKPGRYKLVKRGVLNNSHVTINYMSSRHG